MTHNIRYDDLDAARRLARFEEAQASPLWFLTTYSLLGLAIGSFWAWVAVLLIG